MEILQKNMYFIFHVATVTLPQQLSTLSSFPGPAPPCWGSMQNGCNKAPIREHPAPSWSRNVQCRWFWSQYISLYPFRQRTSIPAAQCGFWLCLSCYQKQGSQHYLAKNKTNHLYPSSVDQCWHAHLGNAGVKFCAVKKITNSSYAAVQTKIFLIQKESNCTIHD